jgi:DNA ligase 1
MLEKLETLVSQLKATSSRNDKVSILKSNEWSKAILFRIYNPDILYGVTSKKCKKLNDLDGLKSVDLYDFLTQLVSLSGHDCVRLVNQFVEDFGHEALVHAVVDKNLKCRIDDTVINLAFPGLIPTFNVALAKNYSDHADYVDDDWLASQKLDGVRLVVRKEGSNVTYRSRQGKYFTTLEALTADVRAIEGDFVLDGEVCLVKDGVENFQDTMKEIRKKNHTIKNPKFYVFDILTLEEFDAQSSKTVLLDRLDRLDFSGNITKLDQVRVGDLDNMYEIPEAWEGRILRKNVGYEGKRTKNLLKVKIFDDAEYEVLDVETGTFQLVEDGREIEVMTVTNVLISHKGNRVSVGSGFSVDERKSFYKDPKEIVGKTITVQYFGTSTNKNGKESLRFPTVRAIHGKQRTT